jgi:hypothetical protein
MRSVSLIEKITLEKIAVKFLTAKISIQDIATVTELSIEKITELQLEEETLTQLKSLESANATQHQQDPPLEKLSADLLDFDKAKDLSEWIDGRISEEDDTDLLIEKIVKEDVGITVAKNMIMLEGKFSREDIVKYTNIPIEKINEIHIDIV